MTPLQRYQMQRGGSRPMQPQPPAQPKPSDAEFLKQNVYASSGLAPRMEEQMPEYLDDPGEEDPNGLMDRLYKMRNNSVPTTKNRF